MFAILVLAYDLAISTTTLRIQSRLEFSITEIVCAFKLLSGCSSVFLFKCSSFTAPVHSRQVNHLSCLTSIASQTKHQSLNLCAFLTRTQNVEEGHRNRHSYLSGPLERPSSGDEQPQSRERCMAAGNPDHMRKSSAITTSFSRVYLRQFGRLQEGI
jgi:hypothetical protein